MYNMIFIKRRAVYARVRRAFVPIYARVRRAFVPIYARVRRAFVPARILI